MKSIFLSFLLFSSSLPLSAQFFINLDFESAVISPENIEQNGGWALDWELAAPGWSHSSGDDTAAVYYPYPHVGTTQYYLLADQHNDQSQSSLEGRFSLILKGGDWEANVDFPIHQNAYIAQNGTIPSDSRSIHLLSDGPVAVFFEDNLIPMNLSEGYQWSGDISTYAGMAGILKIMEKTRSKTTMPQPLTPSVFRPYPSPSFQNFPPSLCSQPPSSELPSPSFDDPKKQKDPLF